MIKTLKINIDNNLDILVSNEDITLEFEQKDWNIEISQFGIRLTPKSYHHLSIEKVHCDFHSYEPGSLGVR